MNAQDDDDDHYLRTQWITGKQICINYIHMVTKRAGNDEISSTNITTAVDHIFYRTANIMVKSLLYYAETYARR